MTREISELLLSCIRQVTYQKLNFRDFLSRSDEICNLLPACLEKCFSISDVWHTCTSEILIFKKLFVDGENHYEGEKAEARMLQLGDEEKMIGQPSAPIK